MTTIAQERAALKRIGQVLRSREQAGFRFNYNTVRSVSEPASFVFVHITITNPKSYSSDDAHARAVEAIGISRFPNTGVSYNRLFMQSGMAYEAQPMGRRGAHTVNDKNLTRCVSPGCPSKGSSLPSAATNLNNVVRAYAICQNVGDAVTSKQFEALARAIAADQLAGLVRKGAPIHGHRCVASKDCPAAKMWALMEELEVRVAQLVKTGLKPTVPGGTPDQTPSGGTDVALTDGDKAWIESRMQAYASYITLNRAQTMDDQADAVWAKMIDGVPAGGILIQIRDDVDDSPAIQALKSAPVEFANPPEVPEEIAHLVSPLGQPNPVGPDGTQLP